MIRLFVNIMYFNGRRCAISCVLFVSMNVVKVTAWVVLTSLALLEFYIANKTVSSDGPCSLGESMYSCNVEEPRIVLVITIFAGQLFIVNTVNYKKKHRITANEAMSSQWPPKPASCNSLVYSTMAQKKS